MKIINKFHRVVRLEKVMAKKKCHKCYFEQKTAKGKTCNLEKKCKCKEKQVYREVHDR